MIVIQNDSFARLISESQNRPVSSRRRRTKSGGSRPSAWPLSGDETGSEAYATEYEVIGDAAEDNIRAIRERVRRQREQKELERIKQRELRAKQNVDNLVAEIAKELQNENIEVELKKQEREGRSHQRESSRNRSGKPSSRASKSLPPVPRKEQDCSPRLSAKEMDLPIYFDLLLVLDIIKISLTKMLSDVLNLAPLNKPKCKCERRKNRER